MIQVLRIGKLQLSGREDRRYTFWDIATHLCSIIVTPVPYGTLISLRQSVVPSGYSGGVVAARCRPLPRLMGPSIVERLGNTCVTSLLGDIPTGMLGKV